MTIKTPACYDLSDYVRSVDWDALNPRPALVINRATAGTDFTDTKFALFTTAAKQAGIRVGAYHYFYPAFGATNQAQKFISTIQPFVDDDMILALDIEEQGVSAGMMWTWLEYVRARFPHNLLMIYSRKNILDPISMSQGEKDYFRKIPIWTAGYPFSPDLFETVPSAYIPDQTKYGTVYLWQYGLDDFVPGIVGETDLNMICPPLLALLDQSQPADIETRLFPGVTQHSGTLNGYRWWLQIIDPKQVRYEVVKPAALLPVSTVAKLHGAQIGWNGSDYDRITKELHNPGEPSFVVSDGRFVDVVRTKSTNAVYGMRALIENGIINPRLWDSDLTATEGHARCIFGKTADGKAMHFVSEGIYPNQGLKFIECAQILLRHNCIIAADAGGGGDATLVINGELINLPEDRDPPFVGPNEQRSLPQVLLAYTQEGNSMNGTAREALGNISTVRNEPSRYGTDTGGRIAAGSTIEFTEIVPAVIKGVADNRDDKWFKLPSGKYVNDVLATKPYYTVLTMPSVTPPPADTIKVSVDAVITADFNGKVYEGTASIEGLELVAKG